MDRYFRKSAARLQKMAFYLFDIKAVILMSQATPQQISKMHFRYLPESG
jgi:hypothetical protein